MGKLTPEQVCQRLESIRSERQVWETHWRDIAFYFQPNRREINESLSRGSRERNVNLLDNTGMQASELLASGLHSMLTNPNLPWFELTTGDDKIDDIDEIRTWLQDTSNALLDILNNSNFNTEVHQLYLDIVNFGTAAMLVLDDNKAHVRFHTRHIKDIFIEENHLGVIDQVFREFDFTAENLIAEYGEDKMHREVLEARDRGTKTVFKVIHAVYPREIFNGAADKLMPFVSQHILKDQKFELKLSGFREDPWMTPRWTKTSSEKYGRSPAMNALSDMKTLNKMTETMIVAAQKQADPPLQLPDDGYILPIITRPGGINYRRPGADRVEPLFPPMRVDFGQAALEERRQRIRSAFYADQLQLRDGPQKTATEVLQLTEESNRLMGPFLSRMESEFLVPLVDRVYEIAARKELIDAPPEALLDYLEGKGKDRIAAKYSSMIARAQRSSEASNILRTLEAAGPFIQLDPSVADLFDGDEAVRVLARALNFPQRVIKDDKSIAEVRQARAEAQQQAIQQEQQAREADNMSKMAPVAQALG